MSSRCFNTVLGFNTVLALLAMIGGGAAPVAATTVPDQLVIFGDSLVDSGNIFLATGGYAATNIYNPPALGYYPGRFTNGLDYTDLLSLQYYGTPTTPSLAGGSNYAYGGATAVSNTDRVPDLAAQFASYTGAHAIDPKALYILNFGGNDDIAIEDGTVPIQDVPAYAATLVDSIASTVQTLDAGGATRILVAGIPNPTPTGMLLDHALQDKLNTLSLANATLLRFSYQDFFAELGDPQSLGVPPFTQIGNCLDHRVAVARQIDCTGFVSFDGTHPTAVVQAAIYRQVDQLLAVPEPTAWAMMLIGFGVVGGMARSRQSRLGRSHRSATGSAIPRRAA